MNVVRMWPCLFAIMLLVPTAHAASLPSTAFQTEGRADVVSDVTALFGIVNGTPFTWNIQASHATLERWVRDVPAAVYRPDGTVFGDADTGGARNESVDLSAVQISSRDARIGGAFLLEGTQGALINATTTSTLSLHAVSDPRLDQNSEARTDVGSPQLGTIERDYSGTFVRLDTQRATATISGDVTLILYGVDYAVSSPELSGMQHTGRYATTDLGIVKKETEERDTIRLSNATITALLPDDAILLTRAPSVSVSGLLVAADVGDAKVVASASPITFSIGPDGRIAALVPDATTTASAQVSQGPPLEMVSVVGACVALVALVMIVLARRRAPRDELEIALLAMEERRWSDALRPLDRIAKREPSNASVHVDRALCLEQVGRFEDAAKAFEHALRAAPRHAEAHFYYARTLAKMRESEAARVHLETALEHDPRLVEMARSEAILRGL